MVCRREMKVWIALLAIAGGMLLTAPVLAQEAPKAPAPAPAPAAAPAPPAAKVEDDSGQIQITLWTQIKWGGWIGHTIILLSVVGIAMVIDLMMKIRMSREIPPDLLTNVKKLMTERAFNDVLAACKAKPCLFSNVVQAGLLKLRHDFTTVQDALAGALDKGGTQLHARINNLSFIASIAPMMGLYGTVAGMVQSFSQLARASAQNKPELLAQGVSQALITTAEGLTCAIPILFFYFILRNRVNGIIIEVETAASDLFEVFRPPRKG